MATSATTPTVIHTFPNSTDGYNPVGPLIQDGSGNLYGVTQHGGTDVNSQGGNGVVFKMNTTGSTFTPLATQLNSGDNGYNPGRKRCVRPKLDARRPRLVSGRRVENYGVVYPSEDDCFSSHAAAQFL